MMFMTSPYFLLLLMDCYLLASSKSQFFWSPQYQVAPALSCSIAAINQHYACVPLIIEYFYT